MDERAVRFASIELERDGDVCVRFRRDSFVVSFGSDEGFVRESGANGELYLAWLRERIRELPDGCVHVWEGDSIVGQLELRVREESRMGYVMLFYLVPEVRGTTLGDQLHAYARSLLQRHGIRTAQLSVSPTNTRAVRYYEKHGWKDLGPRPGHENVNLMELVV